MALNLWIWSHAINAIYQGWESWTFDHEKHHRPATVTQFMAERREQFTGKVRSWLKLVTNTRGPEARREMPPEKVPPPPVIPNNGLVGRLTIPRLHLSAMVREGTGEGTLSLALGHIPHTALPGQPGNVGVAGHRDQLFRGLRNIRRNDLIVFETLGGSYSYQVESTEIVWPENVCVLKAGRNSELTLVTCYPFNYLGSAPERFIVKAPQVSRSRQILAAGLSTLPRLR